MKRWAYVKHTITLVLKGKPMSRVSPPSNYKVSLGQTYAHVRFTRWAHVIKAHRRIKMWAIVKHTPSFVLQGWPMSKVSTPSNY